MTLLTINDTFDHVHSSRFQSAAFYSVLCSTGNKSIQDDSEKTKLEIVCLSLKLSLVHHVPNIGDVTFSYFKQGYVAIHAGERIHGLQQYDNPNVIKMTSLFSIRFHTNIIPINMHTVPKIPMRYKY